MTADGRPGRRLSFGLSRRAFFRALFLETKDMARALQGNRSFSLWRLGELPDDELARLVPVLQPGLAVTVEGQRLVARRTSTGERLDLAPASPENVLALNLFDGRLTLGTAGRRLASQMEWDRERGFVHVRDLFLELVERLVYLPRNAPEAE
jgi:hypothetical protein